MVQNLKMVHAVSSCSHYIYIYIYFAQTAESSRKVFLVILTAMQEMQETFCALLSLTGASIDVTIRAAELVREIQKEED